VVVNGVVLGTLTCTDGASGTIAPFDLIAAGAPTGNVTLSFVGTEDGTGTGEPDIYIDNISLVTANCAVVAACDFPITANYNCAGCTSCANATCTTTQACNDNDPCTTNDVETIISSNGSICVPCAGTAIPSCSGSTTVQACNDGNVCTTNDVRTVDACDGSVCVPCAGTLNTSSCNAACTTTQTCNDGNVCTTNDMETVAANGSVCVPCAGTLNTSSCNTACTTTQACNDNNPCTTNDVVVLAANGSVCTPCVGTLNTSSCNVACTTTQSCNDNNPCTTNDIVVLAGNGSICTPCAGTLNTASCNAACTTTQACNDNNDCTVNDVQTIAANGSICVACAGTVDNAACCANVNLDIFFDGFPSQTSWDITDSNGNVVASSSSYGSQTPNSLLNINPAVCLNDGCYTLNFYDSLSNGMCPFQSSAVGVSTFITPGTLISPGSIVGTLSLVATPGLCGNYNLTDANGTSLASGGGNFGAQQIKTFCLNNGLALAPRYNNEDTVEPFDKFIKQETSTLSVDLMPNPVHDLMTIYHHFETNIDVKVIDVMGKIITSKAIVELNQSAFRLDVSDLQSGVYFIQINSSEGIATKKFIKE